jgi:hypothetical protein
MTIFRYAAVAEEHAECSVCFEPLCHGQLAVFAKVCVFSLGGFRRGGL